MRLACEDMFIKGIVSHTNALYFHTFKHRHSPPPRPAKPGGRTDLRSVRRRKPQVFAAAAGLEKQDFAYLDLCSRNNPSKGIVSHTSVPYFHAFKHPHSPPRPAKPGGRTAQRAVRRRKPQVFAAAAGFTPHRSLSIHHPFNHHHYGKQNHPQLHPAAASRH
jgi:hypothetical protein